MKKIAAILGTAALSATALFAFSPTAHATTNATCYGSSCYHKDPSATGCGNDAITAKSARAADGTLVELRYSATCRAAWTRISNTHVGAEAFISNTAGQYDSVNVAYGSDVHTSMVNDVNIQAHGCYAKNSGSDFSACTGWY
ncbi:DUF2690 domain-containing protein [Kitasatospora sp. NPDC058444]|uniref:DUF2690 domain-containing protein n=1 Tax=Kitasatospora sp. NPDC058444 TaxID=3346504 RepID=UPI00365F5283